MAEKLITLNLAKRLRGIHETRRRKVAANLVREEVARNTKAEIGSIRLSGELNTELFRHLANSVKPIKLRVVLGESGSATVVHPYSENAAKKGEQKISVPAAAKGAKLPAVEKKDEKLPMVEQQSTEEKPKKKRSSKKEKSAEEAKPADKE